MRTLNLIDLAFQTLVLGVVLLLSLSIVFTGGLESVATVGLYGAVLLGPWQLISSIVTTAARGLYFRWRVIHLVSSGLYIALFSIGAAIWDDSNELLSQVGGFFGFLIPAVLALFYYVITFRSFKLARTKRS